MTKKSKKKLSEKSKPAVEVSKKQKAKMPKAKLKAEDKLKAKGKGKSESKSDTKGSVVKLLVGTRKGAWILKSDGRRKDWSYSKPILFGCDINHFVANPYNQKIMIIAAKTGHLGPTVYRSSDGGKTFTEASKPPAFPKSDDPKAKAVERVFCITPGHETEPGVWYAGTSPAGLFRSEDNGDTWAPVSGFNDNPMNAKWTEFGATPDGQFLHSVSIDPRDENHMYLGISIGGVFETTDQGGTWHPLNKGVEADFLPDATAEYGHDPHCIIISPKNPDRLYQQNHCGFYTIERPGDRWERVGLKMPKQIGDIGFPVITHPDDDKKAWVFPMDGTTVWPRTSPEGKPAVYSTKNAGKSWTRLDKGMPKDSAWWTVYRQGLTNDNQAELGIYFGTSSGEIWGTRNEGDTWNCFARHLPKIQSLSVCER